MTSNEYAPHLISNKLSSKDHSNEAGRSYLTYRPASFDKNRARSYTIDGYQGAVAQLGERYIRIVEVAGSSPACSTMIPWSPINHPF